MISVRAIYDGRHFRLREKVNIKTPKEVIITFLDPEDEKSEDPTAKEIHEMILQGGALDFLNDEKEDIYTDDDLKIKF